MQHTIAMHGHLHPAAFTLAQGLTLKRHIEATLGSGNIRDAVRLPVGEDLFEWLAVNTVDFYNAVSVLFGTLDEYCTVHSCSLMTAGSKARRAPHLPSAAVVFASMTPALRLVFRVLEFFCRVDARDRTDLACFEMARQRPPR